jgi:subtilisin family serine protease
LKTAGVVRRECSVLRVILGAGSAFVAAAVVAACGGAGSPPPPPPPPTSPTPTPPVLGCNANPTSFAGGAEPLARRSVERGPKAAFIPGLISVKFSGNGAEPDVARALARIRAAHPTPRNQSGLVTFAIPADVSPIAAASVLAGTRGILEAKPIAARYVHVIPNDQDFGPGPPYVSPYTTPPHGTQVQWDMYYTQMPAAWDITEGSPSVLIAVIDTGYDANNIDICSKVAASAVFDAGTGIQDTANTAQDDDGHGSDVSGIAASVTNNVTRFAGVGWNVGLLEVRVFPTPSAANPNPSGASSSDIASAINWAVSHGARVINMSLGGIPGIACDSGEQTAITNAVNANVAVVVSSGNDGGSQFGDPANCNGVIVAGASAIDETNPNSLTEKVAGYSDHLNSHTWGLVAPGGDPTPAQSTCGVAPLCDDLQWIQNAYSTTACCPNSSPPNPSGFHGVHIAGTSMAAPHVAGVVALMISKDLGITPGQIASILVSASNNDDICAGCVGEGTGRLNARKALNATP